MKPIHANPQSGRAIEPGLVLRIVSKRGRTVMFGQTGLLFANRQWGTATESTKTSFDVKLNIKMTVICAIPYDISSKASSACYLCYINSTATSLTFGANTPPFGYGWIAIGKQ